MDSLTTIRKLKDAGCECYFEKENIWTFDGKGELLLTMAAMAQPYLLDLFITREGDGELVPSASTIGIKPFFNYATMLTGGYCVVFFSLEMFSFLNYLRWVECVVGSTLVTVARVMAMDSLRRKKD